MAITYPRTLPTATGIRNVDLGAVNSVAYSQSPFTFAGQAQASAGQMWQATVTLPPMKREDAAVWVSWLISLRGQFKTFLMGDPSSPAPQGLASVLPGLPVVNGAGQTGETLNITGASASKNSWLKAGDYIQLGSGSTATLHRVLEDANTNASGQTTLSLWPHIRTAPSSGATVTVNNAVGRWRLASNETNWSVNEASIYGISFTAMEAI